MRCLALSVLLSFAALSTGLGCGSSNSKEADASTPDLAPAIPDLRPATMDSSAPDARLSPDSATDGLAIADVNVVPDASVTSDLPISPDLSSPDLGAAGADRSAADIGVADQGGADTGNKDMGGAEVGGDAAGSDDATSTADATSPAEAAFDPGPTVPIVVNSGNTATYNLGDGQWKRFSFPVEAGQIYAISDLSGIVRGYVSAQATVSPSNSTYSTDATTGRLTFTASAAGTYYIAVAVVGGGASGSFQVADGGKLLALGATSLTLTAPNAEDFYFFRFPVAAGKGYHLKVAGPIQPNVGLAVSARAERSNYGELAYSDFGTAGSMPLDGDITAEMVAKSVSGYYYFYLNLHGDMTLTVTISELP